MVACKGIEEMNLVLVMHVASVFFKGFAREHQRRSTNFNSNVMNNHEILASAPVYVKKG